MSEQPPTLSKTADKALVPAVDNAPAPYGAKSEVKALSARIMAVHPSAKHIGERGALLLAQLGIALGLNPLPGTGHIHAWIDDDGFLCIHIGLEGRTSLARRQSLYSVNTRSMRADEIDEHGLKPGDRGQIAELFRHDLTKEAAALGIPIKPIIGIGIARGGERVPKGRSLAWRASQRAIKDALQLGYSFELPGELAGAVRLADDESAVPEGVIDGSFTEGESESSGLTETSAEPTQPTRPYSPEALRARLAEKATGYGDKQASAKQRGLFVGKLAEVFAPDEDADMKRITVMQYLFGVDSSKALTGAQIIAGLDWLSLSQDTGGEWLVYPIAGVEVRAVYAAVAQAEPIALPTQGQKGE